MPGARPALALLGALSCAAAWAEPAVRVVEHGEYTAEQMSLLPQPFRPGTTGVVDRSSISGVRHLRTTSRIEARLCTLFGLRYVISGLAPWETLPVTIRITHPPLTRPDGRSGTVETDDAVLPAGTYQSLFSFDQPWEAAPGTWSFAIISDGKVLAEQAFEILEPSSAGGTGRCQSLTS